MNAQQQETIVKGTFPAYLHFSGINATVGLDVDQKFFDALPIIFPNWAVSKKDHGAEHAFAGIRLEDGKYYLSSPFLEKTINYPDELNAICSLIVELAWARLREGDKLLCLHGAAIEFNGRLLLLPSTRRAGKSTLTVALAAAGKKVFTDDFLPLEIAEDGLIRGLSNGISPRLRLPVPDQIGNKAMAYIQGRGFISNQSYKYVIPLNNELANFGDSAPIGGMVFLDRVDGAKACIEKVGQAEALKNLITQNFSRAMNAGGILKMLEYISSSAPAYRLTYDQAEDAIALLESQFAQWETPAPRFTGDLDQAFFTSALDGIDEVFALDISDGQFMQAENVTEVATDGKRFLTGRGGKSIHYLNDGAAVIWKLLEEPTSTTEATELLCEVFPEQSSDQISSDVLLTFDNLAKNGLLKNAEAGDHV